MSGPVTDQLGVLSRDLNVEIERMRNLELAAVKAEAAFKVAYARAFLSAEGSVQAREQVATIATEELRIASGDAAALAGVQRASLRALHARIDVGRTMVASERILAGA